MDIADLSLEGTDVLEDGVLMSQLKRSHKMKGGEGDEGDDTTTHHQMQQRRI